MRGFTLIEILVAMVFMSIIAASVFPMVGWLITKARIAQYDSQAAVVMQDGVEISYNVLLSDWTAMTPGNIYSPLVVVTGSGQRWGMGSGSEVVEARFTREITVETVCRDIDTGQQAMCGGGAVADENSKLVTAKVEWLEQGDPKETSASLLVVNLNAGP